ncbi:MAG: EAL domain-containing protein, partial [Burkholderiales bacterium]|nr:EAL domain-containing protein [Burkholderiales bacterium]
GLLLAAALALAVVEPLVHALRRQSRRLERRSLELERLALVGENTSAAVLVGDAAHRVQWVNAAFTSCTGWGAAEVEGALTVELLAHPLADQTVCAALRDAVAAGRPQRAELRCRRRDGSDLWLDVELRPLHDAHGTLRGFITVGHEVGAPQAERGRVAPEQVGLSEVADRGQGQQPLYAAARADRLTGLPDRGAAMARLERALAHARSHRGYGFALLFIDFDRFKHVNHTLGHDGGDELLRQIAERLRLALRPGDELARVDSCTDLAARLGGDEFAAVLDGVRDADTVAAVADRLLRELAEPFNVLDHPVRSSASIGIVCVADGADGVESAAALLRDADTAMYEAKRAGRGRWVMFERSMHERLLHTMALEHDLRRALRGDELFVAYQPVVELASGRLSGVEALVRWQHPERGTIGPAEFVPVAEECGLVGDLGHRVLMLACRQFMHWQRTFGERAPATLAVNLSRAQLDRPGFTDEVAQVLQGAGMSAQQLQLEVTEALAAQDARAQAVLRELKARGVRLALDDFGSGYSSLACLHQLPVDSVKIDRTFVRHAQTVEVHRVLIEATIRVARTLGMTTVAEGIETEGQAALLAALACDRGQGWLYGRPMTADELERWLPPAAAGIVVA